VAFQSSGHTLIVEYRILGGGQNDVVAASPSVFSAPAIFVRRGSPAGEIDIASQGPAHTLTYYSAPKPASAQVPFFSGLQVTLPGTIFGG
jgi:hypothetical protein